MITLCLTSIRAPFWALLIFPPLSGILIRKWLHQVVRRCQHTDSLSSEDSSLLHVDISLVRGLKWTYRSSHWWQPYTEHKGKIIRKRKQALRDKLFQYHCINHKSHTDYSRTEFMPPQRKAGDRDPELWAAFCWSTRRLHTNHASREPLVTAAPSSPASVKTSVKRRKKRACCSYGNEMRDQDNRKVAGNHKAFVFPFALMSTYQIEQVAST